MGFAEFRRWTQWLKEIFYIWDVIQTILDHMSLQVSHWNFSGMRYFFERVGDINVLLPKWLLFTIRMLCIKTDI